MSTYPQKGFFPSKGKEAFFRTLCFRLLGFELTNNRKETLATGQHIWGRRHRAGYCLGSQPSAPQKEHAGRAFLCFLSLKKTHTCKEQTQHARFWQRWAGWRVERHTTQSPVWLETFCEGPFYHIKHTLEVYTFMFHNVTCACISKKSINPEGIL